MDRLFKDPPFNIPLSCFCCCCCLLLPDPCPEILQDPVPELPAELPPELDANMPSMSESAEEAIESRFLPRIDANGGGWAFPKGSQNPDKLSSTMVISLPEESL